MKTDRPRFRFNLFCIITTKRYIHVSASVQSQLSFIMFQSLPECAEWTKNSHPGTEEFSEPGLACMSNMVQYLILVMSLLHTVPYSCSLWLQPFPSCLYFLFLFSRLQPQLSTWSQDFLLQLLVCT